MESANLFSPRQKPTERSDSFLWRIHEADEIFWVARQAACDIECWRSYVSPASASCDGRPGSGRVQPGFRAARVLEADSCDARGAAGRAQGAPAADRPGDGRGAEADQRVQRVAQAGRA